MYKMIGSKNLPIPIEIPLFVLNDFARLTNNNSINIDTNIIVAIFLVIEKSNGFSFKG